jgi:hypothetical protein
MVLRILAITMMVAASLTTSAQQSSAPEPKFVPASYHGLRFGKFRLPELEAKFGKPRYLAKGEDGGLYAGYSDIGPVPGKVEFWINPRTHVVESMSVSPENMSKARAIKVFGPGFILTQWEFAECRSEGGMAPIFRTPGGQLVRIEYRQRGIAISLDGDRINEILYLSAPFGLERNPCKEKK